MDQFQTSEKLQLEHLLFIDKGFHELFSHCYTFTFCLTKPVDIELKNIVVVIQAHERSFVA